MTVQTHENVHHEKLFCFDYPRKWSKVDKIKCFRTCLDLYLESTCDLIDKTNLKVSSKQVPKRSLLFDQKLKLSRRGWCDKISISQISYHKNILRIVHNFSSILCEVGLTILQFVCAVGQSNFLIKKCFRETK